MSYVVRPDDLRPLPRRRQSRLALALQSPARPTPLLVWLLALVSALLLGVAVTSPAYLIAFIGAIVLVAAGLRVLARPVDGLLLALCVYPFYPLLRGIALVYRVPVPLTLVGMWPELVLTVIFTAYIVGAAARKLPPLKLTREDTPFVLLVLSGVYAVILSVAERDVVAIVYGFHATLTPFLFYFAARWMRLTEADLVRVMRAWLIPCVVLVVLSLLDYAFRPDFIIRIAIEFRAGYGAGFDPYEFYRWYPRMQSLLFGEQLFGTLCAVIALFCLAHGAAVFSSRPWWRRWEGSCFAVFMLCMALSMSRGALICFGVGAALMFLLRGRHRRYIGILAVLAAVGIGGVLAAGVANERVTTLVTRLVALSDTNNQLAYDRMNQWRRALDDLPTFPSGFGLGRRGAVSFLRGTGKGNQIDTIVDGGIWKILAEQGIPGTLVFLVGMGGAIVALYNRIRVTCGIQQAIAFAAMGAIGGLFVQNIGSNILDSYFVASLCWMLAGLAMTPLLAPITKKGAEEMPRV